MKNKIDVVTKYFYPVSAGIETNIIETYAVLAASGWDVTLHTSNTTLDHEIILSPHDIIRGIKVKRYKVGFFGFKPKIDYSTTKLICLHNFNVFPHLNILVKAMIDKIKRQKKYGIFLTPHGGFTPEWPTFSLVVRLVKRLYHQSIGKYLINHIVDGVRAISNWEYNELCDIGIKKSIIIKIENGLDPIAKQDHSKVASSQIESQISTNTPYILSIGRISRIKNYETTIKALALSNTKLNLLIVGPVEDAEYKNELVVLIKSLKLNDRVKFLGVVNGHDKYKLIYKAVAFVHMARWESFCNVVYEAMSLGKLCIVADNTALLSLVDRGRLGVLTPTFNTKSLANIFKNLNKENIPTYSSCLSALKKKSFPIWSETAKNMNNIYQKIIGTYAKIT